MKSWSTFVKRHWFKGLLLVEAIVLILAVVRYVHDSKTLEHRHFEATDFELLSGDISEDWSYYFVSETGEGARHFILGPYCDLSRGSYRTTVHYDTTASATMSFCWMYSDEAQDKDILCDNRDLARDHSSISTNFYLTNTVRKLQCRIIFMDDGVLNFYGVDIDETMDFDNIVMAGLICILILIPVCILLIRRYRASGRKMSKQSKYILTGLVAVTLAACGPCFLNYAITTHDYQFHAVRIEGIKDGWLACGAISDKDPTNVVLWSGLCRFYFLRGYPAVACRILTSAGPAGAVLLPVSADADQCADLRCDLSFSEENGEKSIFRPFWYRNLYAGTVPSGEFVFPKCNRGSVGYDFPAIGGLRDVADPHKR